MFEVRDVSAKTSPRVIGVQRLPKRAGVMLHTTDGTNSLKWLQGGSADAGRPASADYLVTRSGLIYKLIPKGGYAYHAGICRFSGGIDDDDQVSRLYIGVEIENADRAGQEPTVLQHRAVAGLVLRLSAVALPAELSVIGHYGFAHPLGRRSDPYQWDWGYMFWLMAHAKETITLYGAVEALNER